MIKKTASSLSLDARARDERQYADGPVIAKVQNEARVGRNEYRKLLGSDLIREIVLK